MTPRQSEVFGIISAAGQEGVTNAQLQEALSVGRYSVRDVLKALRESGLIDGVGRSIKAKWCLPEFAESIRERNEAEVKAKQRGKRAAYKRRKRAQQPKPAPKPIAGLAPPVRHLSSVFEWARAYGEQG